MSARFKAGIVGAGAISEFHIDAVKAIPDLVELVGVTDLDPKRAAATADRLGTKVYSSLDALVAAGANVIHVLTPPSSHVAVALAALERGCHVLVEKPISEDEAEGRKVADLAKKKGLTVSVGHSLLFDPQIKRALDAVKAGKLGDVVSVDILRGSEFPPYEGGPLPPWYRSAGYPFRDLGIHCLYLIQELLGPVEDVEADWRSLGGDPNLAFDEWRALVRCKRGRGQFQLTWNVKPMQSQLIIHGTKAVLRVDRFATFQRKRASTPLPTAAERLLNAFTDSLQRLVDVPRGVWKFVRKDVQAYQGLGDLREPVPRESRGLGDLREPVPRESRGLRDLVADFYRRLAAGEPPPVPADDAIALTPFIERVARAAEVDHATQQSRFPLSDKIPFLVTGASGSFGGAVVRRLVADGKKVRAFVRRIPARPIAGVEYCFGNLGDPVAVDRAVAGAETVIHVGASMKGGWPEHLGGTVVGTQNVIDACKKHHVDQLVHISSMSVVDWAGSSGKTVVAEDVALEPRADERGAYTRAKLEAEQKITAAAKTGLRCVILRPGQIFGGGIPLVNGAVARKAGGMWLILGNGKLELPLVYIDDVVDSIIAAVDKKLIGGEIIQIIDDAQLKQTDVLDLVGGGKGVIKVPRAIVFALGKLSELPLGALGKPSPIALYRLKSALAELHYASDRAQKLLGWQPRVGVREGIRRVTSGAEAVPPPQAKPEPRERGAAELS